MSKSNTASNYAIGIGAYYLLRYSILFYPAIVMMVQFGSLEEDIGLIKGILATVITVFIIWKLFTNYLTTKNTTSLLLLVAIYLITLCPFFQYIHWVHTADYASSHPENFDKVPFAGFDWIPFL